MMHCKRFMPSADGSILVADKLLAEHFDCVLNRPSSINNNAINSLPQIEYNVLPQF